jgi:hypothetical protein
VSALDDRAYRDYDYSQQLVDVSHHLVDGASVYTHIGLDGIVFSHLSSFGKRSDRGGITTPNLVVGSVILSLPFCRIEFILAPVPKSPRTQVLG